MPPLVNRGRLFLIKSLLENYEAVMPIPKLVDLALLRARISALSSFRVEIVLVLLAFKPLSALCVTLRQHKCQRPESFLDEASRENVSASDQPISLSGG